MFKLPGSLNRVNLINELRTLSWEAADILLHYAKLLRDGNHNKSLIKSKNDNEPVTLADLEVNELIINKIYDKFPEVEWQFLSEENIKNNSDNLKSDWLFILDPLDGTKDFIQGTGNYAMHLALNFKNRPYIGIVLIPDKEELWISDGKEVWCEKKSGIKIKTNLSFVTNLSDMRLVSSVNHRNELLENLIKEINFKKIVKMGSIGCKIASILRGESDIYISLSLPGKSSPKDWDFAAPEAVLIGAGGAITDIDNQPLSYNSKYFEHRGIIVASNSKVNHHKICHQIKKKFEGLKTKGSNFN